MSSSMENPSNCVGLTAMIADMVSLSYAGRYSPPAPIPIGRPILKPSSSIACCTIGSSESLARASCGYSDTRAQATSSHHLILILILAHTHTPHNHTHTRSYSLTHSLILIHILACMDLYRTSLTAVSDGLHASERDGAQHRRLKTTR
eukprot:5551843-Pyramimonas_sp.AAC.1